MSGNGPAEMLLRRSSSRLAWLGLALVAAASLAPLLFEPRPVAWVVPFSSAAVSFAAKAAVVAVMLAALGLRAAADRRSEPWALPLVTLFAALAAFMTALHWYALDVSEPLAAWQRDLYFGILNHTADPPHVFRPLPYGFTRTLERLTGDWVFSFLAYRWFFCFWFVWASYRFARRWYGMAASLLPVGAAAALYPLSIRWYWGQLTDPVNHALFVLALIYVVEERWLLLAATLALAVPAKETALLVVPAAFASAWCAGGMRLRVVLGVFVKTAALGGVGLAAFLAVRLPLGWRPGNESMNGLPGLMIGANLGLGEPIATSTVPLSENYVHPAVFVGVFLPFIAWGWRRVDVQLKAVILTLTPLLLFSNLCFGWMYESRNYMPLVPLLATTALAGVPRAARRER